ncbi:hypothetical protein APY03_5260 [Variovorax sp. WDL1]|nr:hypothetical protein APY03_5260 [Variovorax sp. WDL1]
MTPYLLGYSMCFSIRMGFHLRKIFRRCYGIAFAIPTFL